MQAESWFVTTVKHGTALEALARRRPRLDILKRSSLMASDLRAASARGDIPSNSTQSTEPATAARLRKTAGGKLRRVKRFDINRELVDCRDKIARELARSQTSEARAVSRGALAKG